MKLKEAIVKSKNDGVTIRRLAWLCNRQIRDRQIRYVRKMGEFPPFLARRSMLGDFVPWMPSPSDRYADDWEVIEP